MILEAEGIAALQYFLMDAAKRYRRPGAAGPVAGEEWLASAAALDYVLLLSSRHADEIADDAGAAAVSVRETVGRAAGAALDVVDAILRAPDEAFDDFIERHVRRSCIFELVRDLLRRGAVRSDDVAFRNLTLVSEILERRRHRPG